MSFATKPITMATNGCLNSIPSLFTKPNALYSHSNLLIPLKPLKLHLSLSTLKKQTTHLRSSVIAALQEENNPVLVEEQEFLGNLNWDNQETSEGEVEVEVEVEVGEESDGVMEVFEDDGESDGYAEPPEEAKMYVGNLPFDVDSEKLAQLFEQAGVVEISEVIYNRVTDQSRGFGFVTMSTVEEAEKAVEMFHRYDLNGRLLVVNKATPKGSRPERPPRASEPAYRIYVGNLPWSAHDGRLEQIFSEHGKVVSARVVYDRESGRSRGFGFVTMSSESEMNDAIANLDGQSLDGRVIRVNIAEERARNNSF